ncbi:MAG: hypothetical protein HY399_06680 [Elusimicrobia bacterium]|nr:hypothetical protein [Elusimicrobiota bacterium]
MIRKVVSGQWSVLKKCILFTVSCPLLTTYYLLPSTLFMGCVTLTPDQIPSETSQKITQTSFQDLDPGAYEEQSLHFKVKAYGAEKARAISRAVEEDYNRIMQDTGLYSFIPRGLYGITVYSNREEYLKKTGQAEWSGGVAVGNAIYSFESPYLNGTLAHEMTHLIFYEFMGNTSQNLRWLNEGLAMYEEYQAGTSHSLSDNLVPIPFSQMVNLVPATERERLVGQWYHQVKEVVQFMVEQGGRLGFSIFLNQLRSGESFNQALSLGFPGLWSDIGALEKSWLLSKGL